MQKRQNFREKYDYSAQNSAFTASIMPNFTTVGTKKRETFVDAFNKAVNIFTAHTDDSSDQVMDRGLRLIADAAGLDRIDVYRLSEKHDFFDQVYSWKSKEAFLSYEMEPTVRSNYLFMTNWLDLLTKGQCINGKADDMKGDQAIFCSSFEIKSLFLVPIFLYGEFKGVVSMEDHTTYRYFEKSSLDLLHSAAYLTVNTLIRMEKEKAAAEAVKLTLAVTNADPFPYVLFDEYWKAIDCNNAALQIFECLDKQFFLNHYWEVFLPRQQPNGNYSAMEALEMKKNVHLNGKTSYEIYQQTMNGELIPMENTLTQIMHQGKKFCVSFKYDLRSTKKMMNSICEQGKMLKDALDKAMVASKAKGEFLSNMSHEMRTPLNAIISMTTIGKNATELEKKNYTLGRIEDASKHLLLMINDILDMSKIEANKFELSPVEFNFEKMLQKVINVISFQADGKKQKLETHIDKNIPEYLLGDEKRLVQVITNLAGNAVKFTPDEGSIKIKAEYLTENDSITTENPVCSIKISVIDTGIGISYEQQQHLFQSFHQAENSISRKYGGTGLGLAISKSIVEMMGGRIWIESELSKGATFSFTVQLNRAEKKPDSIYADEKANAPDESAVMPVFEGRTILLTEDVEINREIVLSLLEPTKLEIECAENGKIAVEMVRKSPFKYDMILMDLQMPEMDGLTATREIRKFEKELWEKNRRKYAQEYEVSDPRVQEKPNGIPIIAMTANVFQEDVEKCLAAGMNGHLGKPLSRKDIIEKLRTYMPKQTRAA